MQIHRLGLLIVALVAGGLLLAACSSSSSKAPASSTATGSPPSPSASASIAASATTTPAAVIPPKYQTLYNNLSASLDAYEAAVAAMPAGSGSVRTVAAAELLPANGNRLDDLLSPGNVASVDQWLDKFKALGITGVTVGIKLPMLLPAFGPNSEAYTVFFATVADHAHARGLTVDVELGPLFCGTVYARCSSPFDGTYQGFLNSTVAQAKIVIDRVKPDHLTILDEATTYASLSGVKDLLSPEGSARYVHDVLAGIGDRKGTKIGAGGATWLPPAYNEAILKESVDDMVLHIYPISAQIAATIVADTALARQAGKPIVVDEVGLYKTDSASPAGAATAEGVYRLDNFSFFAPLDVRFLTITSAWAKKAGVTYLSHFWAGQFFAYLTWTPELDALPYQSLTQQSNQAVAKAFQAGELSVLGRTWPAVLLR